MLKKPEVGTKWALDRSKNFASKHGAWVSIQPNFCRFLRRRGTLTTTLLGGPNGELLGSIGEPWSIFIQSQSRAESNSA
jgi:hypothetical protein